MPTFETLPRFEKDWKNLVPEQRAMVRKVVLEAFVPDLTAPDRPFRPGLRVKGVKAHPGVFEMTRDNNRRATLSYGAERVPARGAWCGGAEDRAADVWETLVAITDAAGDDWPERARKACQALAADARPDPDTAGERLLSDLFDVWGDADELFTTESSTSCAPSRKHRGLHGTAASALRPAVWPRCLSCGMSSRATSAAAVSRRRDMRAPIWRTPGIAAPRRRSADEPLERARCTSR